MEATTLRTLSSATSSSAIVKFPGRRPSFQQNRGERLLNSPQPCGLCRAVAQPHSWRMGGNLATNTSIPGALHSSFIIAALSSETSIGSWQPSRIGGVKRRSVIALASSDDVGTAVVTPVQTAETSGTGASTSAVNHQGADVGSKEQDQAAKLGGNVQAEKPWRFADCDEAEKRRLILAAIKPPMYSVAVVPVMTGAACAFLETGFFPAGMFWKFVIAAILVIAWTNLSNDAFDADTEIDKNKKESVVNITGSRNGTMAAAWICLAVGSAIIFSLVQQVSSPLVGYLLALSISCGYVYQCPPFRLGYLGLGEPLCWLAFGPSAVTAFYIAHAAAASNSSWAAVSARTLAGLARVPTTAILSSIIVAFTTTAILFCSHFHQEKDDLAAGKKSPIVRLGTKNAAALVPWFAGSVFAVTVGGIATGTLPIWCLLILATFPAAKKMVDFAAEHHDQPQIVFKAKYFAVRWHIAVGMALFVGLLLGRFAPLRLS